ncbi:family 2 encapsulin nanocompartment cargo protein terpene cyclase [Longispora albida]|uniref:family 2 encapsulin nanocompartment cargo protein terpene cyclase n=1 Tax=Longispora albida TaxID=203523 RepID=UPI00036F554E|nr:family 2 encapsulin nanocompartment cargo protein terpene cyclase [Longispora albida]
MPDYIDRPWGDGRFPPLYCPPTPRVDDALAEEVNKRLVVWAEETGIYPDRIDKFRDTGFGRLATLAHPDSDDPDMILISAMLNAGWWASDDYFADETSLGANPDETPGQLALVMSAMDPPPPAGEHTAPLERAITSSPVLMALRSATEYLTGRASRAQVMRVCNITSQMYVSWNAYVAWRRSGRLPSAWRYLGARQHDSFYTSMTLIDIVGGYELPPDLFADRRFHHALMRAGTASVIVNDLHSLAREAADELPDSNLALLIAADRGCPLDDAIVACVELHNQFVRDFEASCRDLADEPCPELHRFLRGARDWMGGGFEWHSTSPRYQQ